MCSSRPQKVHYLRCAICNPSNDQAIGFNGLSHLCNSTMPRSQAQLQGAFNFLTCCSGCNTCIPGRDRRDHDLWEWRRRRRKSFMFVYHTLLKALKSYLVEREQWQSYYYSRTEKAFKPSLCLWTWHCHTLKMKQVKTHRNFFSYQVSFNLAMGKKGFFSSNT